MSDWHEEEAKAECLDLRIKVRELEAQVAELETRLAIAGNADAFKSDYMAELQEQLAEQAEIITAVKALADDYTITDKHIRSLLGLDKGEV